MIVNLLNNGQVGQLRQTLLKHSNKLLESENRVVSLQFEIERSQEELVDKKIEVEKCPKPGEIGGGHRTRHPA